MEKGLISVIVPVYNVEQYLEKCVNSITNQTYRNLEIILVDDGSTDNSGKICDHLAKNDSRIKVIHKKNGGVAEARNFGIDVATGENISFIDSDDYINSKYFEILYKAMVANNAEIVICDYIKFEEDKEIKTSINENCKIVSHDKYSIFSDYYNMGHKHEKIAVPWGKVYKTKLFKNIRYPVGAKAEDELTQYKIFDKSQKTIEIKEKLYYYLRRNASLSSDWYTKPRIYMVNAFYEELNYFINKKDEKIELMVVNRLLRELKYNYKLNLKITKKYGDEFIKYYEKYHEKLNNAKFDEFYHQIKK